MKIRLDRFSRAPTFRQAPGATRVSKPRKIAAEAICLILAAVLTVWPAVAPASEASHPGVGRGAVVARPYLSATSESLTRRASFGGESASHDVRRVADWVVSSGDSDGLPFIIVDKIRAKVFVFDSVGRLRGATLALLGRARGDDTVPGIGSRKLKTILPTERTTPAGRFKAVPGHDFQRDILWIDYDASISLHRVITGDPGDHRLQRIVTTSALDKRITYGCINVPVVFYEKVVLKTINSAGGIVYILPETKRIEDVFALSDTPRPDRR